MRGYGRKKKRKRRKTRKRKRGEDIEEQGMIKDK